MRYWLSILCVAFGLQAGAALAGGSEAVPIVQRRWFEVRSAHFNLYSCASPEEIYKLETHLEQFREAYTRLAGAQAVASPPIVVMAFPDSESLKPFLPLYHGEPANLAGFFKRATDENLIVLALPPTNSAFTGMGVIFHEYTHLLLRRNAPIWPLWLNEGMAEIYSTFETTGFTVRIGRPIEPYLDLLSREPLLPLRELFSIGHNSPQYNERDRQGVFYAQSWLLTHFLVAGGSVAYQSRFEQFTRLLREGQTPVQAFTNALWTTLPAVEADLRRYLERRKIEPLQWALPMDISSARPAAVRVITPVETYFRLGDELLRLGRLDSAETYFRQAEKLAPASPLPYEGLGLLAAERDQREEAVRQLQKASQLGPMSFLAHYVYAREKYHLTARDGNLYAPLKPDQAAALRAELIRSITLMPDFGPAHGLLGFLDLVQGDDLTTAERHLRLAIQLEPENESYLFSLAQLQMRSKDLKAARQTLGALLLPSVDAKLRAEAEKMIREIERTAAKRPPPAD